ncbi:MAG: glycosyltransferase family 9 protein [Bacteroidales bacterium]|nr:glycosyltransferase family 9 protein [Bacteroidales bacterium]
MKVLIIRLSSIGDILLTTPLVRCVKQQLHGCVLHFLTKPAMRDLLASNANVDKVLTLGDSISQTVTMLDEQGPYDYIIDLHNNHRSRMIRARLKGKKLIYRKENLRKWLTIVTKRDLMSSRHVVDRYMRTVMPLGVSNDNKGLELALPHSLDAENFRKTAVGGISIDQLLSSPYAVVACGAQHATKRIPPAHIATLCSLMKVPVLLLGDGGDRSRLDSAGATFGSNVVNLCGKTTLLESAALIRDAAVVVAPDSSMMHFAAAFHRPVVAVWGATVPQFGFAAYATPHIDCQVDTLHCRPCSRMGSERCPLGHFDCMHKQDWQRIATAAKKYLSESTI